MADLKLDSASEELLRRNGFRQIAHNVWTTEPETEAERLQERVETLEKALREWLDADDVLDPTRRDVNCDCYPHTRWREARAAARKLLEQK